MLNNIWKSLLWRSFSKSAVRKKTENTKPGAPVVAESQKPNASLHPTMELGDIPKEWEKRILVMSGKYKSYEEIPKRVSFSAMDKAKSKMRIKIANLMIVGTLIGCLVTVLVAKQNAKNKNSVLDKFERKLKKVQEEGKSKNK